MDVTPDSTELLEQLMSHLSPDGNIICDTGVSGDEVVAKMLESGKWKLSDEVVYCAGKRIQTLVAVEES